MKPHEYISAKLRREFEWGKHDCAMFAAEWINAATGVDMLAGYPSWTSEREANEVIALSGGLATVMDSKFKRIARGLAQDGDIALREGGLCIFSGSHIVTTGQKCLFFADRSEAECAWSLR